MYSVSRLLDGPLGKYVAGFGERVKGHLIVKHDTGQNLGYPMV